MAGFFSEDFLEEVRSRNSIVEVVSGYVPLKQKGQNYWGCCPFHQEKTPSFSVNADKQMYYCFGCHAGGNVIHFLMHMERLDFVEAVKQLAERAHLTLPDSRPQADVDRETRQRNRLYEINRLAARFFHDTLNGPLGRAARDYLDGRGLSGAMITRFGLGFAPDSWDALIRHMAAVQVQEAELVQAGLAIQGKRDHPYDAFRNRVMFPIIDPRGRVIGFGGRVMDGSQPKYLNSPDTPVFNKRWNLYGLNLVSKKRPLSRILVMEGYMDVISLHRFGFDEAVASLGTALTPEQAKLIKRYAGEVILAYDGDSAGQKATLRGLDILAEQGLNVRVAQFPDGMDPDEFIRKRGAPAMELALQDALELTAFKIKSLQSQFNLSQDKGRADYATEAARVIAQLKSPIEQERYLKPLSVQTGYSLETLKSQVGMSGPAPQAPSGARPAKRARPVTIQPLSPQHINAETQLLSYAASGREMAEQVFERMEPDQFVEPLHAELAEALHERLSREGWPSPAELLNEFPDAQQARRVAAILEKQTDWDGFDSLQMMEDCIRTIRVYWLQRHIDALKQQLGAQFQADADTLRIVAQIRDLTQQLRETTDAAERRDDGAYR